MAWPREPTIASVVEVRVRHHFGDDEGAFGDGLLFASANKSFEFECPGVDVSEAAYILFQSRDVDFSKNPMTVNGDRLFGGVPISTSKTDWNANIALVGPGTLAASGNVLHIGARTKEGFLVGGEGR